MINVLIIPVLASFFICLFLIPFWIKKARQINLLWDDMNKLKTEKVAGSGGIAVVVGFIIGVLLFVAYRVFYLKSNEFLTSIFALLVVVLCLSSIGLIDDLLGWQHGGLSKRSRLIMAALASIPLIAINAGDRTMVLPLLGNVNLGLIYPLILIPIGIVGATATFNFLAGFNGLEAGQGILVLSALSIVAFFTGSSWLALIGICMAASLFAFLIYNFYPARVFPGGSLTYAVGGLIAIMAILGNFEKIAVFFFIPYIVETILKVRGKLQKHSFGTAKEDGALTLKYDKIYGLTHAAIWSMQKLGIKPTEKRVVYSIWIMQIAIIIIGLIIFRNGIFVK